MELYCFTGSNSSAQLPAMDAVDKARQMRQDLLVRIERLGDKLPANSLDELIDLLGGPDNVAEVCGCCVENTTCLL